MIALRPKRRDETKPPTVGDRETEVRLGRNRPDGNGAPGRTNCPRWARSVCHGFEVSGKPAARGRTKTLGRGIRRATTKPRLRRHPFAKRNPCIVPEGGHAGNG
jgi:hypothetical protein